MCMTARRRRAGVRRDRGGTMFMLLGACRYKVTRSLARNLSVGGSCTVLKHFGELFVILHYLAMANRFH